MADVLADDSCVEFLLVHIVQGLLPGPAIIERQGIRVAPVAFALMTGYSGERKGMAQAARCVFMALVDGMVDDSSTVEPISLNSVSAWLDRCKLQGTRSP